MNYMWEALILAADQGLTKEDVRFTPARVANPYREVFFEDINSAVIGKTPIEVNAYYRFGTVLSSLLREEMDGYAEIRDVLFDILTHYLSELDLSSGLCRTEYYMRFLGEDVLVGLFGRANAERFGCFSRKERRLVMAELLRVYRVGTSMRLFAQLLRELYPNSIVYLDARDVRELLVYVGKKQTKALFGQLELLCDLFVPADYDVKLFWEYHFGLIGTPETMEIGQIMMY